MAHGLGGSNGNPPTQAANTTGIKMDADLMGFPKKVKKDSKPSNDAQPSVYNAQMGLNMGWRSVPSGANPTSQTVNGHGAARVPGLPTSDSRRPTAVNGKVGSGVPGPSPTWASSKVNHGNHVHNGCQSYTTPVPAGESYKRWMKFSTPDERKNVSPVLRYTPTNGIMQECVSLPVKAEDVPKNGCRNGILMKSSAAQPHGMNGSSPKAIAPDVMLKGSGSYDFLKSVFQKTNGHCPHSDTPLPSSSDVSLQETCSVPHSSPGSSIQGTVQSSTRINGISPRGSASASQTKPPLQQHIGANHLRAQSNERQSAKLSNEVSLTDSTSSSRHSSTSPRKRPSNGACSSPRTLNNKDAREVIEIGDQNKVYIQILDSTKQLTPNSSPLPSCKPSSPQPLLPTQTSSSSSSSSLSSSQNPIAHHTVAVEPSANANSHSSTTSLNGGTLCTTVSPVGEQKGGDLCGKLRQGQAIPKRALFTGSHSRAAKKRKQTVQDDQEQVMHVADEFELCPALQVQVQSCIVCGVPEDMNYTLLCDSCLAAFHTFCLVPNLGDNIPKGDWQCHTCAEANAPIFVRDPYIFFYPEICHSTSTNMCDVTLLHRIMRWLLRHRQAARWEVLDPFVFYKKEHADLPMELAALLLKDSTRRRFSAADFVALLVEYAPYVEGDWGHKMLVIFDKQANDIKYYDSLGPEAFSFDPEHIYAVSRYMLQHLGTALQHPGVGTSIGMTATQATNVLEGRLQHRCEYVCQSWVLLIFDALISGTCTAQDFRNLSSIPDIAYEPRCIPGTTLTESVVFRTAGQLIVLYHTFHLRRLLHRKKVQREGAPRNPFGLPWGMMTDDKFPKYMGASRQGLNSSYLREYPWIINEPFLADNCTTMYDPLDALKQYIDVQQITCKPSEPC